MIGRAAEPRLSWRSEAGCETRAPHAVFNSSANLPGRERIVNGRLRSAHHRRIAASSCKRPALGAAAALTAGFTGTARGYAANETISVGLIGVGGRCRHLLGAAARSVPGVKSYAVCDVWDKNIAAGREAVGGNPFTTKDHRALLDRKDIDAVLIATPDHWHVPITIDACAAGKDVYVEKPLTHDLAEGQAVIDAQNKHNKIVQVGTQQRSMPQFQQAFDIVRSGKLGKIHKVHLTWNRNQPRHNPKPEEIDPNSVDWKRFLGNAPDQPFDPYRFRNWRWFWDFGGGILTDLMVHFLDVANWYLELDHPQTAATIGDHFMAGGLWQTPDTVQTLLHYPEPGVQIYYEGTFVNARNAAMLEFMGSEGDAVPRSRPVRSRPRAEQQAGGQRARTAKAPRRRLL